MQVGASSDEQRDEKQEAPLLHPSLIRAVYVIGGETDETAFRQFEKSEVGYVCTQLGEIIARSGADLIVCSPFADSADYHTVRGYVKARVGGRVEFHSPRHEDVLTSRGELEKVLGQHTTKFRDYFYPRPEDEKSWGQAWLLCQLQALEYADVVIAVGGRVANSATTLLHLAQARRLPIVPFAYFGGAAQRVYQRVNWERLHPGLKFEVLRQQDGIRDAMAIAERLVSDRFFGVHRERHAPSTFFISRAISDNEHAQALATYLKGRGLTPLIGDTTIRDDRMVLSMIEEAILQSDVCVVLWSQAYALSRWCYDELEFALEREDVGELEIWILNLDGSDIVPSGARDLFQVRVQYPKDLTQVVAKFIDLERDGT